MFNKAKRYTCYELTIQAKHIRYCLSCSTRFIFRGLTGEPKYKAMHTAIYLTICANISQICVQSLTVLS